MNVWVVYGLDDRDDKERWIEGIFSSAKLADEAVKRFMQRAVEEEESDTPHYIAMSMGPLQVDAETWQFGPRLC